MSVSDRPGIKENNFLHFYYLLNISLTIYIIGLKFLLHTPNVLLKEKLFQVLYSGLTFNLM